MRRFDHVALAVRDVGAALAVWGDALGARFVLGGDNHLTGNRIVHLALGGFKLELMQPLRADSLLTSFLGRRGEGFHHVTLVVDDLETTVHSLEDAGLDLRGTDLANPVWRETFVPPRAAGGALVQLADTDRDWSVPVDGIALEDVLAGRAEFRDAWPCWRDGSRAS